MYVHTYICTRFTVHTRRVFPSKTVDLQIIFPLNRSHADHLHVSRYCTLFPELLYIWLTYKGLQRDIA